MGSICSIIIVNYNGGPRLHDCVESVFRFTSNFELILVDNGSNDDSTPPIAKDFPQTTILKLRNNVGFARANNLAIRRARGHWLVLLNPDTKVTKNWLEALVDCAGLSDDIGIVTPKLLRMDGLTIDSAGHDFDFRTGFTRDRGAGEIDKGQYDLAEELPSCCFACVALKREALAEVGMLDDRMFLYFEDVDYCIRARIAGWRVMYCPASVVFHARGGLTPRSSGRIQHNSVAYRLRIILKCYTKWNAVKYGLERSSRDFKSSAAGIKNKDFGYSWGYLRSPIWNLLNLPVKEREQVQLKRKVSDAVLLSTKQTMTSRVRRKTISI